MKQITVPYPVFSLPDGKNYWHLTEKDIDIFYDYLNFDVFFRFLPKTQHGWDFVNDSSSICKLKLISELMTMWNVETPCTPTE